jgi:hypothetical protein
VCCLVRCFTFVGFGFPGTIVIENAANRHYSSNVFMKPVLWYLCSCHVHHLTESVLMSYTLADVLWCKEYLALIVPAQK